MNRASASLGFQRGRIRKLQDQQQVEIFDWRARGARPHPIGSLSHDRLEQMRLIVGQILGS